MKRKIKFRYVLLSVLLIAIVTPFVLWRMTSHNNLDIVVVNKTFPLETDASGEVKRLDYGKQRGFYWLVNYLGIDNPASKKAYNVRQDYYGNFLKDGKLTNKPLEKLAQVPDVIFLSDMYGTGNARVDGEVPVGVSGMTKEEVGVVASSYERGTTVIGEYNIAGDPTKASVSKELEGIFGLQFTGLAGKFFSDLSSTADVPNWIRSTYEKQYGKKWTMTGAGIVVAGNDRIVVLQRDLGFTGPSLRIGMSEQAGGYHAQSVDYYNWFEIVKPKSDQSVIAWYDLDLTSEGENQLKPFGLGKRFPAIVANNAGGTHAYYMAGDFTDYRGPDKIKQFLGAPTLYRYFSVDSEGDVSYFYWHFYVPYMTKVLGDVKPLSSKSFEPETAAASDGTRLVSKIADKQFSVYHNGKWNKMYVKGVDIGPTLPGQLAGSLPDDPDIYKDWLEKIAAMNANTIRVYTLMPPAFYRALDGFNLSHPDSRLYVLQNLSMRQDAKASKDSDSEAFAQQAVETTINAIHGNAKVAAADGKDTDVYMNDISAYVLGYLIDPELIAASSGASTSKGLYVSAEAGATPAEARLAAMLDYAYGFEQEHYQMQHPAGLVGTKGNAQAGMNRFDASDKVVSGLFGAYDLFPDDFSAGGAADSATFAAYKSYLDGLVKTQVKFPVLVGGFGLPTSMGSTEAAQGQGIVKMLSIIQNSGAMGGLIFEWADEWGRSTADTSPFMVPYSRGGLWHNVADAAQNYGIVALESKVPEAYSMTLRGSAPLNALALAADESYLYLKADFSKLPDLSRNDIMLYLDTIDRKSGEYMLAPDVNENWSGVEYNIRIQSPAKGDLLVTPSYNASKGSFFTTISTKGIFERMIGQYSPAPTAQGGKQSVRYEDASKLTAGPFANSTNGFFVNGNTLSIRVPWSRLNFTDPSSMLVLNDDKHKEAKAGQKDELTVRMTDGIVPSLVVMDKATKKVAYHFPESVTSPGYKTFAWNTWDVPQYEQRMKSSYELIKAAYAAIQ